MKINEYLSIHSKVDSRKKKEKFIRESWIQRVLAKADFQLDPKKKYRPDLNMTHIYPSHWNDRYSSNDSKQE